MIDHNWECQKLAESYDLAGNFVVERKACEGTGYQLANSWIHLLRSCLSLSSGDCGGAHQQRPR